MSVITKVFVILLTVFSIAFAMATISFVTRQENWRKVAIEYHQTAISEAAKTKVVSAQMQITHAQDLAKLSQLTAQVADLQGKTATTEGKVKELTNQSAQLESQVSSLSGTLKGVQQTLSVTQSQLVSEQDFARKLAARNSELERRNIDLNDRTKELTVSLAMSQQQNRAYLEQISALETRLDQMARGPRGQTPDAGMTVQADVPAAVPGGVAAVAPIRGKITEIRGNLASISVGAADGVQRGMSFMIYRAGTAGGEPTYVATLEISRVDANAAAGQIVRRNEGKEILVGDPVRDQASFASKG